jgi:hypothetical protein
MLKRIRSLTRFTVAVILWAHATFLFSIPRNNLTPVFDRLHTSVGEATVLALIGGFSVLASYGWGNVAVDLVYIYFFPFVCLYYLARLLVRAASALNGFVTPAEPIDPSEPQPYYAQIPTPVLIARRPLSEQSITEVDSVGQIDESFWDKVARHALRPFRQLTLLWCLLLLLTTHRWLLTTALVVVSLQLVSLLVGVIALSFTSNGWFSKLTQAIQQETEKLIQRIANAKNAGATLEVRNAWASLRYFLLGVQFLQDRRRVAQWTVFLGGVTFFVIYLYLALLFSFEYYGIARLQGVTFDWADPLITSVFIPIAYPDLPHTKLLKLAGGIQWACVFALGASTVVSVFREKLEPLYAVVTTITRRMEEEEVKSTLIVLKDEFREPPVPPGRSFP